MIFCVPKYLVFGYLEFNIAESFNKPDFGMNFLDLFKSFPRTYTSIKLKIRITIALASHLTVFRKRHRCILCCSNDVECIAGKIQSSHNLLRESQLR